MFAEIRKMIGRDGLRDSRRGRKSPRLAWLAEMPEVLEDRKLMTVVIAPQYGQETIISNNHSQMTSPPIYLIFRGAQWNTTNIQPYITETKELAWSGFLNVVKQYGGDGQATYGGYYIDNGIMTAANNTSIMNTVVNDTFNGALPLPTTPAHEPIYVVVTSGVTDSDDPNDAGYNTTYTFSHGFADLLKVHYPTIWDGSTDGSLSSTDAFSLILSHEVAEAMSDFEGQGVHVSAGPTWTGGGDDQIGDAEGNNYSYRMTSGLLVQPVWSASDHGWAVDDGSHYTLTQNDTTKTLSITDNGSGGVRNDAIQIDQDASGNVSLILDSNPVNFVGQNASVFSGVKNISLGLGNGSNTILVNSLNSSTNLFLQDNGPGGNDALTVGNGNLTAVQGVVWANESQAKITVDGSKETAGRTYQVTNNSVSTPGGFRLIYSNPPSYVAASVSILEGSGGDTTNITGTAPTSFAVDTGAGINTVTAAAASGPLAITTTLGVDTVQIGQTSLANFAAPVSVSNTSGNTALTLNDSGDPNAGAYGITNKTVSLAGRAVVNYNLNTVGTTSTLTLDEPSASTLTVDSTATNMPVTVRGGITSSYVKLNGTGGAFSFVGESSLDTVIIGNGSLSTIAGPVNLSNNSSYGTAVTLDDRNDVSQKHFVVKSGSISGQNLPTINDSGPVKSLAIHDGTAPNTMEFDSLPTGLAATSISVFANPTDTITGAASKGVQHPSR